MFDKQPQNEDEVHELLNKEFYGKYEPDYFTNKAILLAGILAKKKEVIDVLSEGFEIGKINIGQMDKSELSWLESYPKQELALNSYHAIESMFRLLIAHYERAECPWLAIIDQNEPQTFKKKIHKIIEEKYFQKDVDQTIAYLFHGRKSPDINQPKDDWDKSIEVIKELIYKLGRVLLDSPEYNIYKHGAALFSTELGFELKPAFSVELQESFLYLGKKREKTEKVIVEKYFLANKFMKWEESFATTYLTGLLIHNLVKISSVRLGINELNDINIRSFHLFNLSDIFESGIILTTVSFPLFETSIDRKVRN